MRALLPAAQMLEPAAVRLASPVLASAPQVVAPGRVVLELCSVGRMVEAVAGAAVAAQRPLGR
ncbi:MAG TPA: hypothetical protein VKB56_02890 [Terriglobales bacterium]|nr:hypothetical protein [Terriglobales bacterium]